MRNGSFKSCIPQSCNTRSKHVDGTKIHDFCSKRCAATAKSKNGGTSSRKPSKGPIAPGNCDVYDLLVISGVISTNSAFVPSSVISDPNTSTEHNHYLSALNPAQTTSEQAPHLRSKHPAAHPQVPRVLVLLFASLDPQLMKHLQINARL